MAPSGQMKDDGLAATCCMRVFRIIRAIRQELSRRKLCVGRMQAASPEATRNHVESPLRREPSRCGTESTGILLAVLLHLPEILVSLRTAYRLSSASSAASPSNLEPFPTDLKEIQKPELAAWIPADCKKYLQFATCNFQWERCNANDSGYAVCKVALIEFFLLLHLRSRDRHDDVISI